MLKLDRQTNKLRGDCRAMKAQLAGAAEERDALAAECEARVAGAVERAAAASAAADARAEEATAGVRAIKQQRWAAEEGRRKAGRAAKVAREKLKASEAARAQLEQRNAQLQGQLDGAQQRSGSAERRLEESAAGARREAARARALADEATAQAEKQQARTRALEAQVGQQLVAYDDAMAAARTRAAGLVAERDAARGELETLRAQLIAKGNELAQTEAAAAKASRGPEHYVGLIERMGEDLAKAREANDRWEEEREALAARACAAEEQTRAQAAAAEAAAAAQAQAEGELAELHAILAERNISVKLLKKMGQKTASQASSGSGSGGSASQQNKENGTAARTGGKWGQRRKAGPGPAEQKQPAANGSRGGESGKKKTRPKSTGIYKNVKSRLGQGTASTRANSAISRVKRERTKLGAKERKFR